MRLVVLGTLKIDVKTTVPGAALAQAGDVYERTSVSFEIGGTAASVARACANADGVELSVLAAIGEDAMTAAVVDQLASLGASLHLHRLPVANAGVIIIEVSDNPGLPARRILMSAADSPHLMLSSDFVRSNAAAFDHANALIADCYALQSPESAMALGTALDIGAERNLVRILDLVPHDLPRTHTLRDLAPYISRASVVVIEARTAQGLLNSRWSGREITDEQVVADIGADLARRFPAISWLLRFGRNHIEHTWYLSSSGRIEYCTLFRHAAESRGFGDALLVHELQHVLDETRASKS